MSTSKTLMENLLHTIGYYKSIIAGFIFIIVLFLEARLPLRRPKHPLKTRIIINLCLSALVFAIGAFILRPIVLSLAGRLAYQPFGLLYIIPLPAGIQFLIGFLLMDFSFYYWHRANHSFSLLRRFHKVHHIDTDLDVSTSFRFHPLEVLYSTVFRLLQVGLIGITPALYVFYELVFMYATMFHHSNLRLPLDFERYLNKLIVTPRMHGVHHSVIKTEMDSNYSVIFSCWDKLHKTLCLNVSQPAISIGVAGYQEPEDNRLLKLLALPFQRQRKMDRQYLVREGAKLTSPGFMLE